MQVIIRWTATRSPVLRTSPAIPSPPHREEKRRAVPTLEIYFLRHKLLIPRRMCVSAAVEPPWTGAQDVDLPSQQGYRVAGPYLKLKRRARPGIGFVQRILDLYIGYWNLALYEVIVRSGRLCDTLMHESCYD